MNRLLMRVFLLPLIVTAFVSIYFPPTHSQPHTSWDVLLDDESDTGELITSLGEPDLVIQRPGEDDEIWFYDELPGDKLDGDFTMVVDEDTGVVWKIYEEDVPNNHPKKQNWLDQQVERVEELIDSAKDRRVRINQGISELSGLNHYFDRAEFLSSEITLGLGKHPGDSRTDFVYNPQKERLTVSFKMVFR